MLRQPAGASRGSGWLLALTAGVLLLALFNVSFRLNRESVQEWDESLYATSAFEMVQSGQWVAHTFRGEIDYYNTKPPLNFWLIALSFKAFGVSLVSLRLASAIATWCTVAVLLWWARRCLGVTVSLFAGLVLSTMFAFYYVHAGRTANTDAVNTLLIVLTVVTLWEAREARWRLLWLGPILAAVFLLRGMAVLMPLAIVAVYLAWSRQLRRDRLGPVLGALVLFGIPVGAWLVARWHVDGWRFLQHLFWYDFVARSTTNIEDHPGSIFYYLDVLQRHHYDWLIACGLAWLLFPVARDRYAALNASLRTGAGPLRLLASWGIVALAIPTVMTTKLAWYLHPFYPLFAVIAGAILANAAEASRMPAASRWRRLSLVAVIVLVAGVAESRLIWYSYNHRDLDLTSQGLVLGARDSLKGRELFRAKWDRADIFVAEAMAGARHRLAADAADFLRDSRPGDYFLTPTVVPLSSVSLVGTSRRNYLYRRTE
jgi:4-amino-4-deoxy-L-arabinose transferase-like glycosyltransferase